MLWCDGPTIPGISRSGHYEQLCFRQDEFLAQGNPTLLAQFPLETEGPVQVHAHAHIARRRTRHNIHTCAHTSANHDVGRYGMCLVMAAAGRMQSRAGCRSQEYQFLTVCWGASLTTSRTTGTYKPRRLLLTNKYGMKALRQHHIC